MVDLDRRDKILDVAIELAEQGGFDNVRQRDVAAQAGVALGTLYKTFRSKEDILCAALARETATIERRMAANPPRGETEAERLRAFFQAITRGMLRKPNYARAVLRAMASGEPEVAANVAAYQDRITGLVVGALRGAGPVDAGGPGAAPFTRRETTVAMLLSEVWFAALVGWSAGLNTVAQVVDEVALAADLLLRGLDAGA